MKLRCASLVLFFLLTLSACSLAEDITPPPGYQSPTPAPTLGPLFPASAPDLADGAAIFTEKCAACHGPQGLGDGQQAANLPTRPAALGNPEVARAASPAEWFIAVTQGKIESFMPPFTSLDEQQRWDVVAYAMSLSTTPDELAQGKQVYDANCANCHGADGKKSAKSDFTSQERMSALRLNELVDVINRGVDTTMPAFESKLSEQERYAVAAYLRNLTFASPHQAASPSETQIVSAQENGAPTATAGTPELTPNPSEPASGSQTPGVSVGTIHGKVTNKSGGPLPVDLKVVLHVFQHDASNSQFSEISAQTTTAGQDGSYTFADLPMPESQAFYVSVDYANTTYDSEPLVPTAGQTTYELPLSIYDTTTDASALVADQEHILLDYSKANVIQVVEFYIISNPGQKTVIAAEKGASVVTISLPKGFTNLQFQDGQLGDRYIQTADGFGDTMPVPPGIQQYQLVFAFDLPYSTSFEFSQPIPLNVSAVTFLVSEGVKAEGLDLADGGVKDMGNGGGKYQLYTLGGRKAGDLLKLAISGKPGTAASALPIGGMDTTQLIVLAIGVLGLGLILVGGWLFLRDRRLPADGAPLPEPEGNVDEILDAIIALDDQHKAGNISDEAYQQRRADLKSKLKGKV